MFQFCTNFGGSLIFWAPVWRTLFASANIATVLFGMFNVCNTKRTLNRWSVLKSSLTRTIFSSLVVVNGRPTRTSSLTPLRPSKKALCHQKTWRSDKESSLNAIFTIFTRDLPSITKKLDNKSLLYRTLHYILQERRKLVRGKIILSLAG